MCHQDISPLCRAGSSLCPHLHGGEVALPKGQGKSNGKPVGEDGIWLAELVVNEVHDEGQVVLILVLGDRAARQHQSAGRPQHGLPGVTTDRGPASTCRYSTTTCGLPSGTVDELGLPRAPAASTLGVFTMRPTSRAPAHNRVPPYRQACYIEATAARHVSGASRLRSMPRHKEATPLGVGSAACRGPASSNLACRASNAANAGQAWWGRRPRARRERGREGGQGGARAGPGGVGERRGSDSVALRTCTCRNARYPGRTCRGLLLGRRHALPCALPISDATIQIWSRQIFTTTCQNLQFRR